MEYAGFLLRRERLARNWSQEGLCSGICTVSYLSKIEQGKAAPSPEILKQLMERMELCWNEADSNMKQIIDRLYEALFSYDEEFESMAAATEGALFRYSPCGPDWLLLEQMALPENRRTPLDPGLECLLNNRQLALQRVLQKQYDEAVRLHPSAYFYSTAGMQYYYTGRITEALEALQTAYQMAAQEGAARLMLYCRMTMGNCCSSFFGRINLDSMEPHYAIARRLAKSLHEDELLATIDYNTASTQLEAGQYEKALTYFQSLEAPGRMQLHKLAICCEKLGRTDEALDALDRAEQTESDRWMAQDLEESLLRLVRMRIQDPGYLKNQDYGRLLIACFDRCRKELPSGFAVFHLPWVIEWLEANRQYKQALALLKDFPDSQ